MMTLEEAKAILGEMGMIQSDGTLSGAEEWLVWPDQWGEVQLDGRFSVATLEAIVVYIRWAISPKDVLSGGQDDDA